MVATVESLMLAEFLARPETKLASEFVDGKVIQKPMPQGEHSTLQGELCDRINQVAKTQKLAYAFPELRCTFGYRVHTSHSNEWQPVNPPKSPLLRGTLNSYSLFIKATVYTQVTLMSGSLSIPLNPPY